MSTNWEVVGDQTLRALSLMTVTHDKVFKGEWIFSNRHVMFLYNTWHSTENEVSLVVVTFSLESLALKQKSTAGTASVLCQVGTLIEGSGSTDIYIFL